MILSAQTNSNTDVTDPATTTQQQDYSNRSCNNHTTTILQIQILQQPHNNRITATNPATIKQQQDYSNRSCNNHTTTELQ